MSLAVNRAVIRAAYEGIERLSEFSPETLAHHRTERLKKYDDFVRLVRRHVGRRQSGRPPSARKSLERSSNGVTIEHAANAALAAANKNALLRIRDSTLPRVAGKRRPAQRAM